MIRQTKAAAILSGALFISLSLAASGAPAIANIVNYLGPQFSAVELKAPSAGATASFAATAADAIAHWNQVAVDASGLDHTPVAVGDPRVFGEQLGPVRAARAIAIVHIAVFDSVNAVIGGFQQQSEIHSSPDRDPGPRPRTT